MCGSRDRRILTIHKNTFVIVSSSMFGAVCHKIKSLEHFSSPRKQSVVPHILTCWSSSSFHKLNNCSLISVSNKMALLHSGSMKFVRLWTTFSLAVGLVEEARSHAPEISRFNTARFLSLGLRRRPSWSSEAHHRGYWEHFRRYAPTYLARNCSSPWYRHSDCRSSHTDVVMCISKLVEFSFHINVVLSFYLQSFTRHIQVIAIRDILVVQSVYKLLTIIPCLYYPDTNILERKDATHTQRCHYYQTNPHGDGEVSKFLLRDTGTEFCRILRLSY